MCMNALIRVRVRILSRRELKCITQFTLLVTEPGFKPRAPELLHYLLGPSHGIPTLEKGSGDTECCRSSERHGPGEELHGGSLLAKESPAPGTPPSLTLQRPVSAGPWRQTEAHTTSV